MTITFQALSLVEKAEHIQVRFTLHLRDQQGKWLYNGCKVYMDSYVASNGSCVMVTGISFKIYLLEAGLTQNQETMAFRTLNTVDLFSFIICEDMREHKCIKIVFCWGPVTYDFTLHLRARDHTTWLWRCVGMAFGDFLLGSHNFMIMALGSCVKWP